MPFALGGAVSQGVKHWSPAIGLVVLAVAAVVGRVAVCASPPTV